MAQLHRLVRRVTDRLESRGSDSKAILSVSVLDGLCLQVAHRHIKVKGAVYGATESVHTELSVLLDTEFKEGDVPEVGAIDGGFFRKFSFERGPDAPLGVRGCWRETS